MKGLLIVVVVIVTICYSVKVYCHIVEPIDFMIHVIPLRYNK